MRFLNKSILVACAVVAVPIRVSAQVDLGYFVQLITTLISLINTLIPIIVGVGLLFFIYNLTRFILHEDNDEERVRVRQQMLWGVLALFAIVTLWGLVNVLVSFFNLPDYSPVTPFVEWG